MTRWKIPMLLLICGSVCLTGCGTRTIYVKSGDPVRLRETVRAKVWVFDKDGNAVESTLDLPEGWYCIDLPPDGK